MFCRVVQFPLSDWQIHAHCRAPDILNDFSQCSAQTAGASTSQGGESRGNLIYINPAKRAKKKRT
jgi:hypothetical protein